MCSALVLRKISVHVAGLHVLKKRFFSSSFFLLTQAEKRLEVS